MRTHDAAIRALRARALQIVKDSADATEEYANDQRGKAAYYSDAADYLASITGASERPARPKTARKRRAGR